MKKYFWYIVAGIVFLLILFLFINKNITVEISDEVEPTKAVVEENMETNPTPEMTINKNKTYTATLKTEKGDIVIALTADKTPITVNNFVTLARAGFYNNTIFHRVIKGFMIQGGDPEGTGRGGPGYRFDDEPIEGEYTRGTVAMANAGPDTNGSQFFILHQDNTELPKDYIIFGKVIEGLEVVDAIAEAPVKESVTGEKSTPEAPVKVLAVEIVEK